MIGFCIYWLLSRTFRQAVQMRQVVRKHLNFQRDLLTREAVDHLENGIREMNRILYGRATRIQIRQAMSDLDSVASKWLKPYEFQGLRENVEVMLVVVALLMAFRTFFFQPMAIPTGSAQPTLYGIVVENLLAMENETGEEIEVPGRLHRWFLTWVKGETYYHVKAKNSGRFRALDGEPARLLPLVSRLRFSIGDEKQTIWFPPSLPGSNNFWSKAGVGRGKYYQEGDDILKIRVHSGDHLFVNRFVYNFRRPVRGDIIVFRSTGLEGQGLTPNTHYIKRLVALGAEEVTIGDDRRIRIDGEALDASHPGFEFIYDFNPDNPPEVNVYSGHVNNKIGRRYLNHSLAPLFDDEEMVFEVPEKHYLTFGDNTLNSRDSRYWGSIPREAVIGRSSFVFWPISERFGWHVK